MSQQYFNYSTKETDYLSSKDPILAQVILKVGHIERVVNPDFFTSLLSNAIAQQISAKAYETVYHRFETKFDPLTPETIYNADVKDIKECGMSMIKANYIKNIATAIINKDIDISNIANISDELLTKQLLNIKGIGTWSVQMILIFCLQRPDVISYKDLAIRKAIEKLYGLNDLTKSQFEEITKNYHPYSTIASLYLWEASSKNFSL
jgi:3-methyladenine DNA glycosylase/8-oxoguanine DNA glycosylase